MWNNNYPGQQHHQQGWNQGYANRGYAPPPGPPGPTGPPPQGFPSPQGGGFPGYGPPPGPPPGPPQSQSFRNGYNPSYEPPPGPPPQSGGFNGGYGGGGGGYGGGYGGPGGGGYGGGGNSYGAPPGPPPGPPPLPNYQSYPNAAAPHMPPSEVQNYGPHFQSQDNRDAQPFFQYSQCTGKKRALLIGINYFGQTGELKGCINDVNNVKGFIIRQFGYREEDIVTLTDDATNPRQQPTKENIMQAMQWLVRNAQPDDSLFFHYSGHGGQEKDRDGDEADGYDECIYPVDHERVGSLVDDEMHMMMVKPLPPGCRLTAIFDSCHSGSALDLPYIYSTEGKIKEPNLAAEAGMGVLSAVTSYARGDMSGVFKGVTGLFKTATGGGQKADAYAKQTRTSPADVISWSGCKDSQTSADTVEAGNATGAMSYAFMTSLSQEPRQTYQQLLVNLREILRSKYSQKPQLSSSHPMDTSVYFIA